MGEDRSGGDRAGGGSYRHESYSGLIAVLSAQGRLAEASTVAEEALRASRQIADPSWIAQHAAESGEVAFERGRFADADRLFAESLSLRQQKEEYTVPESELLIAHLRLEEGKWDDARRLADEASREFAAAGRKADQADADAVIAEALLSSGKKDEARKTIETANGLLDDKASPDARIPVLLARARIVNALGQPPAARSDLAAAARLAEKIAWKSLVLEARLAAAELDQGAGAASVAADARALGFERIARRADRLSGKAVS
jgi:tetratricopeptide (TPR) repeat protein